MSDKLPDMKVPDWQRRFYEGGPLKIRRGKDRDVRLLRRFWNRVAKQSGAAKP